MKRKFVIICSILCMSGIAGCSTTQKQNQKEIQTDAVSVSNNIESSTHTDVLNNTEMPIDGSKDTTTTDASPEDSSSNDLVEVSSDSTYEMQVYTKAPNQKSSVKIHYPVFSGNKAEEINAIIMAHVLEKAQLNPLYFSENTKMTVEYQSAVTLQNSKIVSIVFWGAFDTEESQFPTTTIFSLNIDLQSMKLVSLTDLYTINEEFEKIFFEKAFFPSNPITSYSEEKFSEMLKLQTSEYKLPSPFTYADSMKCFLKPEGIVLSMSAVHATGSDHFEAELLYSDIQDYYLPKQIYWKE